MDHEKEGRVAEASHRPIRVELQEAGDFDQENALLLEQQIAAEARRDNLNLPKKKAKNFIDLDALTAEKKALEEIGDTNWIGKLNEYRDAHHTAAEGLNLVDGLPGNVSNPRFTCTVTIFETANHFGGGDISFSNKKSARQYACKKAIDWLIENNFMPADGSVRFPKVVQPQPGGSSSSGSGSGSGPSAQSTTNSFAAQVPDLCLRLGFSPPKYEIIPVVAGTPLYNAWADFGADPRIDGKVGEVSNIYGKKNAKEEVAREVVLFLQDIERQRLA